MHVYVGREKEKEAKAERDREEESANERAREAFAQVCAAGEAGMATRCVCVCA